MKVSIIIPCYNQWSFTYQCIESVLKFSGDEDYEIIIADDCSTEKPLFELMKQNKITLITNETNLGFLKNCNNAVRYTKGKILVFLNNDTQVKKDWLKWLLKTFEYDKKIGIVGAKLISPNGKLNEAGNIMFSDGLAWNYGRGEDINLPKFNFLKETDYVSFACAAVRRNVWDLVGGFDIRYAPAYCEDADIAFAVRGKGYKVVYQPKCEVIHYENISHSINNIQLMKVNNIKLYEKWKYEFSKLDRNGQNIFRGMNRARNKKTILVVDETIPTFDKNAGERTSWTYINLFVEMGYNVKLLPMNQRYIEPYATELQQKGVELIFGNEQQIIEYIVYNSAKFDYAFINRPTSFNIIEFLKEHTRTKLIYYGHDIHHLRLKAEYDIKRTEKKLKEIEQFKKLEEIIYEIADLVLYPSDSEIKYILKNYDCKCGILQPFIYEPDIENIRMEDRHGLLFVGGFNHSPNADAIEWFLQNVYNQIATKHKDIPLVICGSNPPEQLIKFVDIFQHENHIKNIIITGYVKDEVLAEHYRHCRMVIAPLRFGAGVKGKVIEAMSFGCPVITTQYGIQGLGENNGIAVSNLENFKNRLLELYDDLETLKVMSKLGKKYIVEHYSKQSAIDFIKIIMEK